MRSKLNITLMPEALTRSWAFAAAGLLSPVAGAVAQEVIDLLAVLNALRTARSPAELSDFKGRGTETEAAEASARAAA